MAAHRWLKRIKLPLCKPHTPCWNLYYNEGDLINERNSYSYRGLCRRRRHRSQLCTQLCVEGLFSDPLRCVDAVLDGAKIHVDKSMNVLIENGILTAADVMEIEGRMTYTTDLAEAVRNVQFIQESGPESYDRKQTLLAEIEKYTSSETVIASSTSGLLITKIAAQMITRNA